MQRVLIAAVVGLLAGAAATAWFMGSPDTAEAPVRRDLVVTTTVTEREVERHRAERYAKIASIEQVVALPGSFARAEALYALAGRSGSAAVQGLLFDADRIADRDVRRNLLAILVERLTELDPASALVLTRSGHVASDRELERIVWKTWSRRDLDAAIAAANALPSRRERDRAAQAMLAARGYHGNEAVARIERDTGIEPSMGTLTEYLYELADQSTADAVRFIETEVAPGRQVAFANRLAAHLAAVDPDHAAGVATLFRDEALQRGFQASITRERAVLDPEAYLPQLLPGGTRPDYSTVNVVLDELVATDLHAAMAMIDQLAAAQDRELLGEKIARKLAETDPLRAFEWARSRPGHNPQLLGRVLGAIAGEDLELAVELSGRIDNRMVRDRALLHVVNTVAHADPARAGELILSTANEGLINGMLPYTVTRWLQTDRGAALAWMEELPPERRSMLLKRSGAQIARNDPEMAIELLQSIDGTAAADLRRNIVAQLAQSGAIDRAQELIARMPAGEDADALRAALAGGVAQYDVVHARQLVEQIVEPRARDRAYLGLIQAHGMSDPLEAIAMLTAIGDERLRATAVGGPVSEWHRRDPSAAENWLETRVRGRIRDAGIAAIAAHWTEPTARQQRLLDSIADDGLRHQAHMQRLMAVAQHDPARAQTLLDSLDLPQNQRDDLQRFLDTRTTGAWYPR